MRASEKPFNWAEDVDAPSSVGFDHIPPPANADMSRMTPPSVPTEDAPININPLEER
jgi:hypothetical protein